MSTLRTMSMRNNITLIISHTALLWDQAHVCLNTLTPSLPSTIPV